jgi:hypothetical protein
MLHRAEVGAQTRDPRLAELSAQRSQASKDEYDRLRALARIAHLDTSQGNYVPAKASDDPYVQ